MLQASIEHAANIELIYCSLFFIMPIWLKILKISNHFVLGPYWMWNAVKYFLNPVSVIGS